MLALPLSFLSATSFPLGQYGIDQNFLHVNVVVNLRAEPLFTLGQHCMSFIFFAQNLDLNLNIGNRSDTPMTGTQGLILFQANLSSPARYLPCLLLLRHFCFFSPLLITVNLIISLECRQILLDETRHLGCCMDATPEFSNEVRPTGYLSYRCTSLHIPVTAGQVNLFISQQTVNVIQ